MQPRPQGLPVFKMAVIKDPGHVAFWRFFLIQGLPLVDFKVTLSGYREGPGDEVDQNVGKNLGSRATGASSV